MVKVFKSLPEHNKILLALKEKDEVIMKSANNLPNVKNLLL